MEGWGSAGVPCPGSLRGGAGWAAQSLAQQRLLGDEFGAANTLSLLGSITSQMGDLAEAETLLREALILAAALPSIP